MAMRFGVLPLTDRSAEEHIDQWRLAEDLGFDLIGIPDTPAIAREMFLSVSDCLEVTTRPSVITAVSNPVTRDPSVSAAALATLARRHPGRVHYGIGTGDSGVWGWAFAKLASIVSSNMSRRSPLCYGAHRRTLTGVVSARTGCRTKPRGT